MKKEDIEKIVHDYIIDNLRVEVEHVWEYYADESDTKVTIYLKDEEVTYDKN